MEFGPGDWGTMMVGVSEKVAHDNRMTEKTQE